MGYIMPQNKQKKNYSNIISEMTIHTQYTTYDGLLNDRYTT